MDTSNWGTTHGRSVMESGDWRSQLQADSRQRIVNKILDTLKRHLPYSGDEGLEELNRIAVRFEDKIYIAATSQSDYLRKISLKMLTMETRSQNPMPDARQSYFTANNVNPSNPVIQDQGQSLNKRWIQVIRGLLRAELLVEVMIGGLNCKQRIVNKIGRSLKQTRKKRKATATSTSSQT